MISRSLPGVYMPPSPVERLPDVVRTFEGCRWVPAKCEVVGETKPKDMHYTVRCVDII